MHLKRHHLMKINRKYFRHNLPRNHFPQRLLDFIWSQYSSEGAIAHDVPWRDLRLLPMGPNSAIIVYSL
jgi:hypothetical protein